MIFHSLSENDKDSYSHEDSSDTADKATREDRACLQLVVLSIKVLYERMGFYKGRMGHPCRDEECKAYEDAGRHAKEEDPSVALG